MPVRVYEIAKQLGVESKVVLVKAKELGISMAKVPSSSLDKITAEYLLEQLGGNAQAPMSELKSHQEATRFISSVSVSEKDVPKPIHPSPPTPFNGVPVPDIGFSPKNTLLDVSREILIPEPTIVHVFQLIATGVELCASLPFAVASDRKDSVFNREIAVLANREGHCLEFKECLRTNPKSGDPIDNPSGIIARAVAAMMNADGGTTVLGVRDNGEIIGVEREFKSLGQKQTAHGYEEFLTTTLSDGLGAAAFRWLEIRKVPVLSHTIFVIIAKAATEPVYVRKTSERQFFVRQNVTSKHLKGDDATDYIRLSFPKRG